MLDHIILTVRNFKEATAFYEAVLPHLNIQERHDYDGKNGPPGHPDLKGFGANGRMFFWLQVLCDCANEFAAEPVCRRNPGTDFAHNQDSWKIKKIQYCIHGNGRAFAQL